MRTGNGKTAHLPEAIRDELNGRMNDGDRGAEVVAWLNAGPEVQEIRTPAKSPTGRPAPQRHAPETARLIMTTLIHLDPP